MEGYELGDEVEVINPQDGHTWYGIQPGDEGIVTGFADGLVVVNLRDHGEWFFDPNDIRIIPEMN